MFASIFEKTPEKESDIKGGLFLSVPKDLKLKEPIIIKYITYWMFKTPMFK